MAVPTQADPQTSPPSPILEVFEPTRPAVPVLTASPHSGRLYPPDFVAASRLSFTALRRSEDSFVDELLLDAPQDGIALLRANFPRAYCDVNREAWELDPGMFNGALPPWCNTASARVLAGFGTIARQVASGEPIYHAKLDFADAEQRVRRCWQPYHDALSRLIATAVSDHGFCLLLDVHSMPSNPATPDATGLDFVLGDAFGTSCAPSIMRAAERFLRDGSYRVKRNDPYAGGYVTRHYGRPSSGIHVLQIEICRSLYMNEGRFEKNAGFMTIRTLLGGLLRELASSITGLLAAH